jgi:hypothetical protein
MHISRTTTIYIALGIVVLGIVAYFFMGRTNELPTVSISGVAPTSEAQATFISLAAQLEPISFDGRILSDPRFTALQDIHTGIVPETQGRTDPFAPLAGVAASR